MPISLSRSLGIYDCYTLLVGTVLSFIPSCFIIILNYVGTDVINERESSKSTCTEIKPKNEN